jgi:hypothetical protein
MMCASDLTAPKFSALIFIYLLQYLMISYLIMISARDQ